ncbi:hypothetical protein PPYR_00421 [Photinus pyralis]|uniref:Uncharacterized protein n=1 Tax=Photinus pyralis TaxID=7054 RepID=A0A5N4B1G7_PHOPY|nr:hypothetical protein PPYR_00421 [Photinus pyralis]
MQKLNNYKQIFNSDIIFDLETSGHSSSTTVTPTPSVCSTSSDLEPILPIEQYVPINPSLTTFYGEEEFDKLINPTKNFNLKSILEESCMGKIILKQYKDNNTLDRRNRTILVDLIISHIFKTHGSYLSNEHLEELTSKIINLFPTEKAEIYFVKPVKKINSKFSRSQVARGKLVDRYRNSRTKLREAGLLPCSSSSATQLSTPEVTNDTAAETIKKRKVING